LNAQHTYGPGFAAECKAQKHMQHTPANASVLVCASMHWKSMNLAIPDLYAYHRQLTLPAGQGPFLCLPSALTLVALQRWLCLMAPTSASGQQLHCRMPLACKLAPVYPTLLYVRSALHASREAVNMLNMSHSGDMPLCCSPDVCHFGSANLYDAALHYHACCMHLCSD